MNQVLNSYYSRLCSVNLPYRGRQMYMHTFNVERPVMADGFEDYAPIVSALCAAAGLESGEAHMTVDEKFLRSGETQRRPGPHVDGCYMPALSSWRHSPSPSWNHYCNNIPTKTIQRMAIIVASSFPACRAWKGVFHASPAIDGDLSHLSLGDGEILPADTGYLLSPDCIHESMAMPIDTRRTFLRIAFSVA